MTTETMLRESDIRRTSVRLPADLHEAVETCAHAMGLTFNAAVTAALIDFVSGEERRNRVAQFFEEGSDRFGVLLDKLSS